MRILIATAAALPRPDLDSPPLIAALKARGADASLHVWDDPGVEWRADLVLVRSTWDYATRPAAFLAWVERVAAHGRVLNPPAVMRWNAHKAYLAELADAGVPVVPTRFARGDALDLSAADAGPDGRVVVKLAQGAGARDSSVGRPDAAFAARAAAAIAGRDALVQPFLPEIAAGERSLVYFGGVFSHAVIKRPARGDWRVQAQHGGTDAPCEAAPAERALADRALAACPAAPAYARVDVVGPADAPLLMELELIEPELFLRHAPGSTARFAEVLTA